MSPSLEYLERCSAETGYRVTSLEKVDRAIAEQLVPMLAAALSPRSADLLERAWAKVVPLLSVEGPEEAYLAAIHQGELRTELLFPNDAAEAARIAEHPAILWKLANVRARR